MKRIHIITLFALAACGGSLSDEQRKKLREGIEQQQIVRISESEIMSHALTKGGTVYAALEKVQFDSLKIDSIQQAHNVNIRWVTPGSSNAHAIEDQLIEAYVLGMATGALQDNVQKVKTGPQQEDYDSILYSKPKVTRMGDGVDRLEGVWNVYLSKKNVVLEISKQK